MVCVDDHCLLFLATGDPKTAMICESADYCDRPLQYTQEALHSLSLGDHWRVTEVVRLTDLRAAKPALASTKRRAPVSEPRTKKLAGQQVKRHRVC